MELIEVKILDYTFLLPITDESSVSEISEAAIQEYRKLLVKNAPKKFLYACDANKRVLSGGLKILQHNLERKLEVVVTDYSRDDEISPLDAEQLYRQWQQWTAAQLLDHVRASSHQISPPSPPPQALALVHELSNSRVEAVELIALETLQLLMTKFTQRELVQQSAEHICRTFCSTPHVRVAVAALESFHSMNPLQFQLLEGAAPLRGLSLVEDALSRFPPEQQGKLLRAFEGMSQLLGDQGLTANHNNSRAPEGPQREEQPNELQLEPVGTVGSDPVGNQPGDHATQISDPSNRTGSLGSRDGKRLNLVRLEGLLSSDDPSVRHFALEKLLRLFRPDERPPAEPTDSAVAALDAIESRELESLVACLLRCLKKSIHARTPQTEAQGLEGLSDVAPNSKSTRKSTAARLIQTAWLNPETDTRAVKAVVEILWFMVGGSKPHSKSTITKQESKNEHHSSSPPLRSRVNGTPLSRTQQVFARAAREWHRLLLTLSHLDEGQSSSPDVYTDSIAEQCAFLFVLTGLNSAAGWSKCQLKVEPGALYAFLESAKPCYRVFLALSYLTQLTKRLVSNKVDSDQGKCASDSKMSRKSEYADPVKPHPPAKEPRSLAQLVDLCLAQEERLLRLLWGWVDGAHGNRKTRVLALEILSHLSICTPVREFLSRNEVIPRLVDLITSAVRKRLLELWEFTPDSRPPASASTPGEDSDSDRELDLSEDELISDFDSDGGPDSLSSLSSSGFPHSEGRLTPVVSHQHQHQQHNTGHEPTAENEQSIAPLSRGERRRSGARARLCVDTVQIQYLLKMLANLLAGAEEGEAQLSMTVDTTGSGPKELELLKLRGDSTNEHLKWRQRVSGWLQVLVISDSTDKKMTGETEEAVGTESGDGAPRVRLSKIATRDPLVKLYYDQLTDVV